MAKRKSADSETEDSLREFFSTELAELAGSYLSAAAKIAVHVGDKQSFLYSRKAGKNHIAAAVEPEADLHFWVNESTLRHLLSLSCGTSKGVSGMGVAVMEHLFHQDPEKKIRLRVKAPFLTLWARGYFSVLKAGGPEVASYLARVGYDSLTRIKDMLRHFRG